MRKSINFYKGENHSTTQFTTLGTAFENDEFIIMRERKEIVILKFKNNEHVEQTLKTFSCDHFKNNYGKFSITGKIFSIFEITSFFYRIYTQTRQWLRLRTFGLK